MKLIVLDLARSITRDELIGMFKPHGKVIAANIVMDATTGTSKGFGFIEIENDDDGLKAIEAMNGKKFAGQKIRVRVSTS